MNLLKKVEKSNKLKFSSVIINDKEQWEVEKILNTHLHQNKVKYLIKWVRYLDMNNEWLKEKDVTGAKDLIKNFYKEYSDWSEEVCSLK